MSGTMYDVLYEEDVRPIVPRRVTWATPLVQVFVIPGRPREPLRSVNQAGRSKVI